MIAADFIGLLVHDVAAGLGADKDQNETCAKAESTAEHGYLLRNPVNALNLQCDCPIGVLVVWVSVQRLE